METCGFHKSFPFGIYDNHVLPPFMNGVRINVWEHTPSDEYDMNARLHLIGGPQGQISLEGYDAVKYVSEMDNA